MNLSDGKRTQFYDVKLNYNLTFDEVNVSYILATPNCPNKKFNFNMGTKKPELIHQ